jgi:hypothetical protein
VYEDIHQLTPKTLMKSRPEALSSTDTVLQEESPLPFRLLLSSFTLVEERGSFPFN